MPWENITGTPHWDHLSIAAAGFCLFCISLLMRSTSIKHLKVGKVLDLAGIKRLPRPYDTVTYFFFLALSVLLMSAALRQSIDKDRAVFYLLAWLGFLLVITRLVAFFSAHIDFILVEIETDPKLKFNLVHLRRSPLIIGGLILLCLAAAPVTMDYVFRGRFDGWVQNKYEKWRAAADEKRFFQLYKERTATLDGRKTTQMEIVYKLRGSGSRYKLIGRGGIGKTWFLWKLRHEFKKCGLKTVIFINAADLANDTAAADLLDHVVHTAFGWPGFAAKPVTRIMLKGAVVLIDGVDEVPAGARRRVLEAIGSFAQDKEFRSVSIVVATRPPVDLGPIKEFGIMELPEFSADGSMAWLAYDSKIIADLANRLKTTGAGDGGTLHFWYDGEPPDLQHMENESRRRFEAHRLLESFAENLGFLVGTPTGSRGGKRLPFLSSPRDISIVTDLFFDTVSGTMDRAAPRTLDEMRYQMVERFLEERVKRNFKAWRPDPKFAKRVIESLALTCARSLHAKLRKNRSAPCQLHPEIYWPALPGPDETTPSMTLDNIIVESELMVKDGASGLYVFDNPGIEKYFMARLFASPVFPTP